jgi:hypothetical protein
MWMLAKAHEHGLLLHEREEDAVIPDYTDVMHDSRGRRSTRILYSRKSREEVWDQIVHGKPVVHESVLLRAKAAQIRVWRDGSPAVEPGKDYRPWVTAGGRNDFKMESKTLIGIERLERDQEQKWQEWQDFEREKLPWLKPPDEAELGAT